MPLGNALTSPFALVASAGAVGLEVMCVDPPGFPAPLAGAQATDGLVCERALEWTSVILSEGRDQQQKHESCNGQTLESQHAHAHKIKFR